MKRILILLVLISCLFSEKRIAITMDDLPVGYAHNLSMVEIEDLFTNTLDILDSFDIKTIGFVIGQNCSYYGKQPIAEFIERGHKIGNHTWSHPDLNDMPVDLYCEDIKACDSFLEDIWGEKKYFRYPMLHRGYTREKREGVYDCLEELDYTIVPVSIDNDECVYNKNFTDLWIDGRIFDADSVGKEYVKYMIKQTAYFDSLSIEMEGRVIDHILLLHMNLINSLFLDDLLEEYKKLGYTFISPEEAMKDPIYSKKDDFLGKKGESILLRLKK